MQWVMSKFITYIIESKNLNKFYIGYTEDIDKRLIKHNSGGSRWTRKGAPWKVIYAKEFEAKGEAIKYEHFLKNLKNKVFLKQIIAGWASSRPQGS